MPSFITKLLQRCLAGERLQPDEAVALLESRDLIAVGRAADVVRQSRHPEYASFVVDRNINYTNICVTGCRFCAFYRKEGEPDAYLLDEAQIDGKIAEALERGASSIMLQGGLHPGLDIDYYCHLVRGIKERFPVEVHSFSPPEVVHISKVSGISISEVVGRLKEAGLDSIPGGGAEILVDSVRSRISPKKIASGPWLEVMEAAHAAGLKTTATMMFGSVESFADRVEHFERLRRLQDRTDGFRAFIPWTFQPGNTELGGGVSGGHDYLMTLAVSRLYLDNFENIQASWVTQGPKIGQVALSFGANDMGSVMLEENVVRAAGVSHDLPEEDVVRLIRETGRTPVKRDFAYRRLKVYN